MWFVRGQIAYIHLCKPDRQTYRLEFSLMCTHVG